MLLSELKIEDGRLVRCITKDGGVGSGIKGHVTAEQIKAMNRRQHTNAPQLEKIYAEKARSESEKSEAILKNKMKNLPKWNELKNPKKGQEFNYSGNLATVTGVKSDGTVMAVWHGWRGDRNLKFNPSDKKEPVQGRLKEHTKIDRYGNYRHKLYGE